MRNKDNTATLDCHDNGIWFVRATKDGERGNIEEFENSDKESAIKLVNDINLGIMKGGLSEEQKSHTPTIKWLYHGARQTGRSYALACVCIEAAYISPYSIKIIDHCSDKIKPNVLIGIIGMIISSHGLLGFTVNKTDGLLSYKPTMKKHRKY